MDLIANKHHSIIDNFRIINVFKDVIDYTNKMFPIGPESAWLLSHLDNRKV